jgi:hypothetical protein
MNSRKSTANHQLHGIAITACILSGLGFLTAGLTAIAGLYLATFVRRRVHTHTPRDIRNLSAIAEILGILAILIYILPLLAVFLSGTLLILDLSGKNALLLALLTCLSLFSIPLILLKIKDLSQRRLYRRTIAENLKR